jgi:hypothetical protein
MKPLITALALSLLTSLGAQAQDRSILSEAPPGGVPLPSDATREEAAAYDILKKYCAGCHQEGALDEGRTAPKSGFGHVLDLRRLAQDPKFISPGSPQKSKLWQVIAGSAPTMPDDCWDPTCTPEAVEIAELEAWITQIGTQSPGPREFIPLTDVYNMALADLERQPTNRRDRIRYLSMRPMWNDANVSRETYDAYLAATVKALNALSFNPNVYRFEKVDAHGVLLRIFLPDLDWTPDTWARLENEYAYGMMSDTDPHLGTLQRLSQTRIPVIRADWFTATATVAPLYYDILGLPDTVAGLEAMLGLDMARNIRDEQVIRAGFQDSGVSTNNRLIERHPLGTGFFWTSYDFAGSVGRQSFFQYPLGPANVFGEDLAFTHDGGESIFTLPNGFHAYYLNTADGERLNVGPTAIVRDTDYPDGTGEVVNGISCISCHSKGMRLNKDRVREASMGNLALSPAARQTIDALYPGQDTVDEYFQKDMRAFFAALEKAGIDPETKAAGLEPVRGLFVYHVDYFLDFAQAASELGLTEEELRARMPFATPAMAGLLNRLDTSPIARDEWTAAFPVLLESLTDFRPVRTNHKITTALSHSVRQILQGTDYAGQSPSAPAQPIVSHDDARSLGTQYDPLQRSVTAQSHLTVYTDKPTYKVGDPLQVFIEPRFDCRLTLISIDDDHDSCVLYPFPGLDDFVIPGGTQYVFPPKGALRTSEPGMETILAICNGSDAAIRAERRATNAVSCSADHQPLTRDSYGTLLKETLVLDLNGDPDAQQQTASGADYRAVSDHNPDVTKAQISVFVRAQ